MNERCENTVKKHAYLRDIWRLVVMKECAFRPTFSQPCEQILTTEHLLKQICDGKYFGAVVCDIHVPDHLTDHFAKMTPIFKNVDVSINDVGVYMQNMCEHLGEVKTLRQMLIGSYFGEQVMVASPLLQWYCAHGLIADNITTFFEYDPVPCFQKFKEEVANACRKIDVNQSRTAAGNTAKLIGKLNILFK